MLTYLPFCTCLSVQSVHIQTCTFSPKVMETTQQTQFQPFHCKIQVSKQSWMSVLSFLQRFRFTYRRSNAVQSFGGRNIQECSVHKMMFTPSMRADIVTVATLGAYCSPEVMVVTPSTGGFCQLLTSPLMGGNIWNQIWIANAGIQPSVQLTESLLTWLVKLRCSLDKFMCSWNCWSGKICLLPNFAGIEFGLIWCLCSLWMCLLTVLFLVKDLWQKGQGTLMPWWRCRMWARRLVS